MYNIIFIDVVIIESFLFNNPRQYESGLSSSFSFY